MTPIRNGVIAFFSISKISNDIIQLCYLICIVDFVGAHDNGHNSVVP
jgi:hypothetical protein